MDIEKSSDLSPMLEYEFWCQRYTLFMKIIEQVKSKEVKKNVEIMQENIESGTVRYTLREFHAAVQSAMTTFKKILKVNYTCMVKCYERFNELANAPFSLIAKRFVALYDNLKSLWSVSSFFGDDKQMERVLRSISDCLSNRVMRTLTIPGVFNLDVNETLEMVNDAIAMLDNWKRHYYKCRGEIESVALFRRWEFKKELLFDQTEYVRYVVNDLKTILQIIGQFTIVFGPEMKSIVTQIPLTGSVLMEGLTGEFFNIDFNVYHQDEEETWKQIVAKFFGRVGEMELQANTFIDLCFLRLRTAAGGFKALQIFEQMDTRESMHKRLSQKYPVIIEKFKSEMKTAKSMFDYSRIVSQLPRDQPPVSGNIMFVRELILRAKKTALLLTGYSKELEQKYELKEFATYICVTKEMMAYERSTFLNWVEKALQTEQEKTRETLLMFIGNREDIIISKFNRKLFGVIDEGTQMYLIGYDLPENIKYLIMRLPQIKRNVMSIDTIVGMMGNLIGQMDKHVKIYDRTEAQSNMNISLLMQSTSIIPRIISLIENTCYGFSTGRHEGMSLFYQKYETIIFENIVRMVINNLKMFKQILQNDKAIFVIYARMVNDEFLVVPNIPIIVFTILRIMRYFLERLRVMPRWLKDTAIPCPTAYHVQTGTKHLFSFYDNLSDRKHVVQMLKKCHDSANKVGGLVMNTIRNLKKFNFLFERQETLVLEMFAETNPKLHDYKRQLNFFRNLAEGLKEQTTYMDVGCIRINHSDYIKKLIDQCTMWHSLYGMQLMRECSLTMTDFSKLIATYRERLNSHVQDVESFKVVLQAVEDIKHMVFFADYSFNEIENRFNLMKSHSLKIPYENHFQYKALKDDWKVLYGEALSKSYSVEEIKKGFTGVAQEQINEFIDRVALFLKDYYENGPGTVGENLDLGIPKLKEFDEKFSDIFEERYEAVKSALLFGLPYIPMEHLEAAFQNFKCMQYILELYMRQKTSREEWAKALWSDLNPQLLIEGMDEFLKDYKKIPRECRSVKIATVLESKMKSFKNSIPLFIELKNEAMRERHWNQLMDKTGQHFDMTPEVFTLGKMFAMDLGRYEDICMEIIGNAVKELSIERSVKEISIIWETMLIEVTKHIKDDKYRGLILGDLSELNQTLEDNRMTLQSMAGSQFVGPFLPVVQKWDKNLAVISDVLAEWYQVQLKWVYLEGIFLGGEIRLQLPEEAKRFDDMDRTFRMIMAETKRNPKVMAQCLSPGRLEEFQALFEGFEMCQKSLNEYLNSKRNAFPRFFFISDEELLSILGNSNPASIQEHIVKMFDNVGSLLQVKTVENTVIVTAMISCEKEVMEFKAIVSAEGSVENWMNNVLVEMWRSNKFLSKKAIFYYGTVRRPRCDWILDYQGMICLAANGVWWTAEIENVFRKIKEGNKRAMKDYLDQQNRQLDELVLRVRGDLSKNDRKKFNTILIVDVHARDIIENFVRDGIMESQEFDWESQLRFYWKNELDNLMVHQCSGTFSYGYEYMGLNGRLVITPLTDRIYLTITQALSMQLGGAPAGPAGTGKTETTKDLAKAMGLLCMVTNCGEGMDYQAFGKILNGLCQCGAWGCFDEFNRIDISVLSVISTQLGTIRNALLDKVQTFMFEGRNIKMDNKVGIFITMNPGYAGRTELPETVKALFRPVVCIVPDLELICLIMLFSEGFLQAKVLAKKMTVLYKLAREQLSKQSHYDFGLRALKSVLVMAGELKRSAPDIDEDVVLMRALRDMNLPKFVFDDVPLFLGLISDLFPGLECPRVTYPDFGKAVENELRNKNYIQLPNQMDKVIQMYETMMTRHSTMIVGPTGGGKSVIINMLVGAQTALGLPTYLYTLNPKACTVIELYGVLDPVTRDWTDGLLSNIFREINKPIPDDEPERRYIMFDGDVDALWIENMNSVMDDNKLLTLANGERIRLLPHCALLFEVGDLRFASPATVSRAGMVYVDPKNLGYMPYWYRYVSNRRSSEREPLNVLFEKYVPVLLDRIIEGKSGFEELTPLQLVIPQTRLNMVTQLCYMLDAFAKQESGDYEESEEVLKSVTESKMSSTVSEVKVSDELEAIFISSLYASLGATLEGDARVIFDALVKKTSGLVAIDDVPAKRASYKFIPTHEETWFDYYLDTTQEIWVPWNTLVADYEHNPSTKFSEILVPTVDSTRVTWILSFMNEVKRPVILVGETGTSKTATMQNFLRTLDPSQYIQANLNFSSRTNSMDVQRNLEANVDKRTKDTYGPPIGKKLICFVDDMNMPQVDTYGTQQPIALLKLLLEHGGMYDRGRELNWRTLVDLCFYAAMGKAGGGRNEVDPRFMSMFSVYCMSTPSNETIDHIYRSILAGHTENFDENIRNAVPNILKMTLQLYKTILVELPPTPSKFHYIFNLRDLSRITCGMLLTSPVIFKNLSDFIRVWRNEFTRVICDRLNSVNDQELMTTRITEVLDTYYPEYTEEVLVNPMIYGDYKNALDEEEVRLYEDYKEYEEILHMFKQILFEYNEKNTKIDMVLFDMALEHLTRIHRVLRMDRGHMMLVGVGGSGKALMTKVAAFTAGCEMFSIMLSRGYNETTFRDDIKKLYLMLGVDKKPSVFFFNQSQIAEEGFLEIINNILTIGMVPALFTEEEKDGIVNQVRKDAKDAGYGIAKDAVWNYYLKTCVNNLHVVLSMGPGDELRARCRNFPGLVNNTCINWIFAWPVQALYAVAESFLNKAPKIKDEYRESIENHVVYTHQSMSGYTLDFQLKLRRKSYLTPKHYLDFITLYLTLVDEREVSITQQCERLLVGLRKIDEAEAQLAVLNRQLEEQKIVMAEKTLACELLLDEIAVASKKGNEKKEIVEVKTAEIQKASKIINSEKEEAQKILNLALPALEAARDALSNLDKADITEIRSFATPPEPVQTVTECVAVLRGYKEVNWKVAKGMMSDPNFINTLKELDVDSITGKQQSIVRAKLKASKKMSMMKSISKAGYGLLYFVEAVLQYCVVFKEVRPKKEKVEQLEKEFQIATDQLNKLNRDLTIIMNNLNELNERYQRAMEERKILQEETNLMQKRLIAADKLITGLSSENERWRNDYANLEIDMLKIFGNCLMSASFLAYTAPFSYEFRIDMLFNDWYNKILESDVPISQPFKLEVELCDEVTIATWNSEGLPPDDLSIQNGILTVRSSRFTLCIDPQQQALNWIKKKEEANNLKILSFSDSDYLKYLESSIIYGSPVLFQDVDYIDPIIENVLEKNIKTVGGRKFVILGDKEVDYDPKFCLYLTTKLANPSFNPSVYTKSTVINCSVTQNGLEDQLLCVVVKNERPDLEEQREYLIMETSANKNLLKRLEDSLLRELATSTGNMLDNVDLIDTLEETKTKANDVMQKLALAAKTSVELDLLRNQYRSAATRGAILFFVLAGLSSVNAMYQYSLVAYLQVFTTSLKKSLPDMILKKRLMNIINTLTEYLYEYGCTGIFERHKLLFSFQMALKLQMSTGEVSVAELDFFIKGNVALEKSERANPAKWLSPQGWEDIVKLAKDFSDDFPRLDDHVIRNIRDWQDWYDLDMPESADPPGMYSNFRTPFHKLMLLRCFRVDRVYQAISNYVALTMGETFITPPFVSYDAIYEQTLPTTPVIFILSPGSDPTMDLMKLADRCGIPSNMFKFLSLGQGQEPMAFSLLNSSMELGCWLMLQNCHLLIPFLYDLEKVLDRITRVHPSFRLWLATDATPHFPVAILQRSLKVVTEPPNGLKLNIRNTYFKIRQEKLDECTHPAYTTLIYVLAFFHAVVQERRKYDKIGWNISYDFSEPDFTVCVQILINYLNKTQDEGPDAQMPWITLRYLIGEVMYGGRVIDNFDRRIVNTFMEEYLGDFLFDEFQPFHFYKDDNVDYALPAPGSKEDYLLSIEELPLINVPGVFGLHPNAEMGYFTKASRDIWSNLLELQPQTGAAGAGASREEFIDSVAKDIQDKVPPLYILSKVRKIFESKLTPSAIVLLQELERFNFLIEKLHITLSMLRKALLGEIGMDSVLESVSISLYNGQIPPAWTKLAPQTCKNLGGWIDHFVRRNQQYENWCISGEPVVIWLSGLHIPESYLTAIVQMACRKRGWALDQSTLYTAVTQFTKEDDIVQVPETGCYVTGIYLEGARWSLENECLSRSEPKVLIENLPILSIVPIETHRLKLLVSVNTIRTPVYTTSQRRNAMGVGLVFEADLKTRDHNSLWILQGVCLVLNTD
ncbi:dynein axonemal heavy chain 10-like [Adelges cooleyi]|uniref:dynein axonemal heavy chain 10-like n=1 Tax=Adelges cooleyi TaxID=133065 RepID=UPI00217FB9A4|nr:dynein axonemal heavy chain 10-like [Adelges cooleyi]